MRNRGLMAALFLGASLVAVPVAARQDGPPTLTTDDVLGTPDSTTNVNAEAAAEEAAEAADTAERADAASAGYVRVNTKSGYSFERPATWKAIENLESKGAPSYFKYDAVFQDPKSGAVISAVSVDRSQLDSPIDIGDKAAVNQLLATMLNPANAKDAVKVFRQVDGVGPNGSKWVRIKAQGNGQAVDGSIVDTTFWVQLVQSDARLALVAVGYPSTQSNDVAESAFHTVRTLEIENVTGPAAAADDESGTAGTGAPPKTKKRASGMRKQQ